LNLITHIAARTIATRSGRRISVRACLAALAVAIVAPTLVIAWWLASLSAASVREQHEKNILAKASEISAFVDREIVNARHVLVALAGSPYLQASDLEAFHRQASTAAAQLATQIVLHDARRDEQLINTAVPWGESLSRGFPAPRPAGAQAPSHPDGPLVSDVLWGPIVARYLVAVSMPIVIDGASDYLLSVGIWTERFAEIVDKTQPDAGHLVAIVDRQGAVIARSDRHHELVGKVLPSHSDRLLGPSRGVSKSKDLEGVPFLWGDVRSDLSGWTVSVGLPDSTLDADARLVLTRFAAAGSGVLLIALVAAYAIGGRVARAIGVLGIDRAPTREEFRALFESSPNGVVVVDGDGQIVLVNAQMEKHFGYSRGELVGQPVESLLPERLRGDHAGFRTAFARSPQMRPMGSGRDLLGRRASARPSGSRPRSPSATTFAAARCGRRRTSGCGSRTSCTTRPARASPPSCWSSRASRPWSTSATAAAFACFGCGSSRWDTPCTRSPGNCGRHRSTSLDWRARSATTYRNGAGNTASRPTSTAATPGSKRCPTR
jgi:PAS domain-containing protein